MRVGILTFHQAHNYGAVLQAFALQEFLERLGAKAEIIDYRCDALERSYAVYRASRGGPIGFLSGMMNAPSRMRRRSAFEAFRAEHLAVSGRTYDRDSIAGADQSYDMFIAGSDQVWNLGLTGDDTSYLLDFCAPDKRVSYAASAGQSDLVLRRSDLFCEHLSGYRMLSVRESGTKHQLEWVLQRDVEWVVDPVFLLSASEWSSLAATRPVRRPYIFVYCLHETDVYRQAHALQAVTGMDVVYIPESVRSRAVGTRVSVPSVGELLGLIRDSEVVLTDSYHVTAFSIIFRKDFRVQLKGHHGALNSRVTSLLESVGLEGQALTPGASTALIPRVDFRECDTLLAERIRVSHAFLNRALQRGAVE